MSKLLYPFGMVGLALASLLGNRQTVLSHDYLPSDPLTVQISSPAEPADKSLENGITILGKGPVHEAYAQPYKPNPGPTPVVPKKPPAPIPEVPPDEKPSASNVQWIPGYWSWDPDKKDYIWVSGAWRIPPADRQWMPGYWAQSAGGWQWVPGYWGSASQGNSGGEPAQPDYLPTPPASLDYGPSVPAPDDNSLYVPGNWMYRSSRYLWRPGYWTGGSEDYVWVPASYSWTPAGCVYVNGYWDYPLADRGLLFAPVCFNQPLWNDPGWCYQPNCVFGVGSLLSGLFCRPNWCSYYYGDYYSPFYGGLGFQPWCQYGWRGFGYDPLFNHYAWANRFNRGWHTRLQNDFQARRNGDLPRPGATLADQAARAGRLNGSGSPRTVTPLNEFRQGRQLTRLDRAQGQQLRTNAQQFHTLANQRARTEKAMASGTLAPRQTFGTVPGNSSNPAGRNRGTAQIAGPGRVPSQGGASGNSLLGSRTGIPIQGRAFASGSRSAVAPQTFQRAPTQVFGTVPGRWLAPSRPALSHASPSLLGGRPSYRAGAQPSFHSAAPSFRGSSFRGGAVPSFHSAAPSFRGGGHFSSGGRSGGHGGGHHR
jgi:hypothetical protein